MKATLTAAERGPRQPPFQPHLLVVPCRGAQHLVEVTPDTVRLDPCHEADLAGEELALRLGVLIAPTPCTALAHLLGAAGASYVPPDWPAAVIAQLAAQAPDAGLALVRQPGLADRLRVPADPDRSPWSAVYARATELALGAMLDSALVGWRTLPERRVSYIDGYVEAAVTEEWAQGLDRHGFIQPRVTSRLRLGLSLPPTWLSRVAARGLIPWRAQSPYRYQPTTFLPLDVTEWHSGSRTVAALGLDYYDGVEVGVCRIAMGAPVANDWRGERHLLELPPYPAPPLDAAGWGRLAALVRAPLDRSRPHHGTLPE